MKIILKKGINIAVENPKPSKGLGDIIEKITKATGIKRFVEAVNKARGVKSCGCKKRKDALNKAFPYKK
tara:strand:- start:417 stop:623 length:207 start_codon:yes stop_codon:yes gene_type:complete